MNLCVPDAPYGSEVSYHERVFVVAEVDDSYIYHIHMGRLDMWIYKVKQYL
jgi:hypothetical protein